MTDLAILHVCSPNIGEAQILSVVNATKALCGYLSVFVIGTSAVPPIGAHVSNVSVPWMKERQRDQAQIDKTVRKLEGFLAGTGIPYNVESAYTEVFSVDNEVDRRARLADLVMIGADLLGDQNTLEAVLDGAWFHVDVPVLFDPAASLVFDNPTVMIAWQETAEASSAVRASVPLLKLAGSVHIVIVDDNRDLRDPAPGLLSYLSSRGVENLSAEVVPRNDRLVSHVLDDHAERVGANLVVMGAYGHARLREWVFGGVTRSVVQHLTRPTFMAR